MNLLLVHGEDLGMGMEPCATRTHYPVHRPKKSAGEDAGTAKPDAIYIRSNALI